jgi:hypothetical protein
VEAIGGRLIGGVIWTLLFPIIVAGWGIAATMTLLSLVSVTTCGIVMLFAPETRGRSVEALEAEAAGGEPGTVQESTSTA